MELKLKIYGDNDEVVKEYKTQTFRIKLKVLNDFINILDSKKLSVVLKSVGGSKELGNKVFVETVCNLLTESRDLMYDLFKSVFKGLTDDELNNCYIDELVNVVKDLSVFAIKTIGLGSAETEKN